ncbi:MAG: hypothetical protein ACTSP4_01655 [Candidatus Hodarchaeales archaeon]
MSKRLGGASLNAKVSKIIASKGQLPLSELQRSYDTLFLLETAAGFPSSRWVPVIYHQLDKIKWTDDEFWPLLKNI